jgi:hypothetical protein
MKRSIIILGSILALSSFFKWATRLKKLLCEYAKNHLMNKQADEFLDNSGKIITFTNMWDQKSE